jgi:hypothetical protein
MSREMSKHRLMTYLRPLGWLVSVTRNLKNNQTDGERVYRALLPSSQNLASFAAFPWSEDFEVIPKETGRYEKEPHFGR